MGGAPQTPPHQHVSGGGNSRPGIYIPEHQEGPLGLQMIAGAQGAPVHHQLRIGVARAIPPRPRPPSGCLGRPLAFDPQGRCRHMGLGVTAAEVGQFQLQACQGLAQFA